MINRIRFYNLIIYLSVSFLGFSGCFFGDDTIDQFANFDIDVSSIEELELNNKITRVRPAVGTPDGDLCEAFDYLKEVVTEPIWYNTKTPAGRDLLYLLPYKISALERGGFAFNLFFNMTDNMNVGANSLLNTEGLNQVWLPVIVTQLTQKNLKLNLSEAELVSLLSLFKKITLQERKLGSVIQAGFAKGPFTVQLNTSIHMAERNFWLNVADRQAISSLVGSGSSNFSYDELIRYRYGLGDTRVKVGLNTLNMSNLQVDVGFESIVPTSRFSYSPRYKTATHQIVSSPEAFEADLYNVLRGVRDYLINPRMGNNGHFGLGFYVESKANVFRNLVNIWTRLSYDKLLSADEDRLMLSKQTLFKSDLAAAIDAFTDPHYPHDVPPGAMENLRQVGSEFVKQYLFPSSYLVTVYPGGIFNAVFAASTDIKKMRFSLGYDFYMQQAEKIKKIHNTDVTLDQLRVEDAQSPLVYQHKIFTEALYLKNFKRCDMAWGLGGDLTVASRGIGKDWTGYAKLNISF